MTVLSREEVVALLGPVDDTLIAQVIATGASTGELAEARAWAAGADEALVNAHRPMPSGRVARLVDLLEAQEDDGEDGFRAGAGPHLPME